MARYEITAPSGERFEITAPDDATEDQVLQYAQSQFAQKPAQPESARTGVKINPPEYSPTELAEISQGKKPFRQVAYEKELSDAENLSALSQENPYLAQTIADMNPLQKAAVGFQTGLRQVARGVGLGSADQSTIDAEKALTSSSSAAGFGEIAGNAAPFLPAGIAAGGLSTLPLRAAASAGVGGLEGGIIASGTGKDTAGVVTGALGGAAIGGAGEVLLSGINSVAIPLVRKYFGNRARALDDAGNPTPELNQAMQQEGFTLDDLANAAEPQAADAGALTPERAARNAQRGQAFKNFGITPTEAQRTRDKDMFIAQQDRYKQGGPVTDALEGQEQALSNRMAGAVRETGGVAQNAVVTPIDVITNKSIRLDKEITDLYRVARESAPDAKNVRFNRAAQVLRQYAPDNELSGGVISSLRGTLEQSGALTGFNPSGRVSVDSAEKIRQKANQIFASTNDQGKAIIRQFKDALDEDVGAAAGEDWFGQARAAKAKFEQGLNREKFNKFDERNVNIVRDVLNNKFTADDIQQGALVRAGSKYKAQDLAELKRYLESGSPEDIQQGTQAWNDIRASAMQQIKDTAFGGPATEIGTQQLSRAKLDQALKQIGRQKFNVLFTPKEQKFLYDMAELARYKEPPSGTFMGSGPSAPAIKQLESRFAQIYGINIPVLSNIKGRLTDAKILKINDDMAKLERERIIEQLKPYRSAIGGAATTSGVAAANQEGDQ